MEPRLQESKNGKNKGEGYQFIIIKNKNGDNKQKENMGKSKKLSKKLSKLHCLLL